MADHEDLAANKTEGFKIGEKKTLQEYQQLGMSHDLFFCPFETLPTQHSASFLYPAGTEPGFLYN